jgi:uncharacterized protein YkwD
MYIYKIKPLLIFILGIMVISCSNSGNDEIYFNELSLKPVSYTSLETEVLDKINDYRTSIGDPILKKLDIVSAVADSHTEYMVETGKVDHSGFEERQKNLMEKANAKSVGENVAYGYTTSTEVVNAWLKSESHRALIENKNYTHFGISTEKNDLGRNYYTIIFIKK